MKKNGRFVILLSIREIIFNFFSKRVGNRVGRIVYLSRLIQLGLAILKERWQPKR